MTTQLSAGRRALAILITGGLSGFVASVGLLIPGQRAVGTLGARPYLLVLAAFLIGIVTALVDRSMGEGLRPFVRRMLSFLPLCLVINLYRIRLADWPVSVAVRIAVSIVVAGILTLLLEPIREMMDPASPESQDPS